MLLHRVNFMPGVKNCRVNKFRQETVKLSGSGQNEGKNLNDELIQQLSKIHTGGWLLRHTTQTANGTVNFKLSILLPTGFVFGRVNTEVETGFIFISRRDLYRAS
jgi:hypothetical protein